MNQFSGMIEINARSDYPQLEYGTFRGQLRELLLAQESLISLSEETGGLPIVNSGDLAGGLGRIVLDNSRYYLLGYYSDCREVVAQQVPEDRGAREAPGSAGASAQGVPAAGYEGDRARARGGGEGGYHAGAACGSRQGGAGRRLAAPRVRSADARTSTTRALSLVALEIDGPSLKFEERDGRFAESIEVSIVAADERARVQGGDRQNVQPEPGAGDA